MLLWEMSWYKDIGKEYIESSTQTLRGKDLIFTPNAHSWEIANSGVKIGIGTYLKW